MEHEVKVSVICAAYNHEKYIAKALESFVTQQTDFPFEVIVHDDASTDGTAAIIREYEKKYPDIIRPIYQTENQYQKGIGVVGEILFPAARGTYFAICEGDDYWTDPAKLQKQYDYMQRHPDCPLVMHQTIRIFEDGRYMSNFTARDLSTEESRRLSAEELITHVNDFHLSSVFFRKESYDRNRSFMDQIRLFDYALKILLATDLPGASYMFPEVMSAYRMAAQGSWSTRVRDDSGKYQKHIEDSIVILEKIDQYRLGRYHGAIQEEIINRKFKIELLHGNKAAWKNPIYREIIGKMSRKQRLTNYLNLHMPNAFKWMQRAYQHIKKFTEG